MARGTVLSTLVSMLKAEVGDYSGTNTAGDATLKVLLSNKQLWLATEYEWPFLDHRWDVTVSPGQQYKTFPTTNDQGVTANLNLEHFPKVSVLFNNQYFPVEYGVGDDEYNFQNYSLGQQSDPIRRWRVASNPNEPSPATQNQFEVWPVPVTTQTLRFFGQRAVLTLADNADKADLDDVLLVMFVAADVLARSKQADAAAKAQLAQRRLTWIRQHYPTVDKRRVLGQGVRDGGPTGTIPEGVKLVAIH